MKSILKDNKYNTRLETSDWRYNASIVGLIKYFKHHKLDYYEGLDYIEYNSDDITEERYLLFTEDYFSEKMHHKQLENLLNSKNITEEKEKLINDILKANAVMKKIFKSIKFSRENVPIIKDLINLHRLEIIKETFKNRSSLYAKFNNPTYFMKGDGKVCRLIGYSIDLGKKGKSVGYNWDFNAFNAVDDTVFDFIPFAFSKSREAFFVNNNISIKMLLASNEKIQECDNPRKMLFYSSKESSAFIEYDVETIIKSQDSEYYETLFIRYNAINIFKKIKSYNNINRNIRITDNYYINLEKEVTNSIINGIKLDPLIDRLLNLEDNYSSNISTLIQINYYIYGGYFMDENLTKKDSFIIRVNANQGFTNEDDDVMKKAYVCAKVLTKKLKREGKKNKIDTYKNKLISALTFKDYDRFCEILLQFSAYSGVVFNFAYDLFENFEVNKNIAYTFVNALNESYKNEEVKVNE